MQAEGEARIRQARGLWRATDEGIVDGQRIYPCGAAITQTSGHFDFRGPNDVLTNPDTPLDYLQRVGHMMIADGVPEVIKRTREALRWGSPRVGAGQRVDLMAAARQVAEPGGSITGRVLTAREHPTARSTSAAL